MTGKASSAIVITKPAGGSIAITKRAGEARRVFIYRTNMADLMVAMNGFPLPIK